MMKKKISNKWEKNEHKKKKMWKEIKWWTKKKNWTWRTEEVTDGTKQKPYKK